MGGWGESSRLGHFGVEVWGLFGILGLDFGKGGESFFKRPGIFLQSPRSARSPP